jgi:hypothetical protein
MFRCATAVLTVLFLCGFAAGQDDPKFPSHWLSHAATDAPNLTDAAERCGVYTAIAFGFLHAGDSAGASDAAMQADSAAQQIADVPARFRAELGLIGLYDWLDDSRSAALATLGAQQAINQMTDDGGRQAAEQELESQRAVTQGFGAGLQSVEAVNGPDGQARLAISLANEFAQAGPRHHNDYLALIGRAEGAVAQIPDAAHQAGLRLLIVQTEARAGDARNAELTCAFIEDPALQIEAQTTVAEACIRAGSRDEAQSILVNLKAAAGVATPENDVAFWLDVARVSEDLGDSADAAGAVNNAVRAPIELSPADRVDADGEAARIRAELGDLNGAAVLVGQAEAAAGQVSDPQDQTEAMMSLAAAQARCGMGTAARQSIAAAEAAGAKTGGPTPAAYLEVVQCAAGDGDFGTAQAIADNLGNPLLRHDAVLAIAGGEVKAAKYQAAEDAARNEGSADAEAAVCGIIAGSIARNYSPADAGKWIARLSNPSDRIAACLAVAQVVAKG